MKNPQQKCIHCGHPKYRHNIRRRTCSSSDSLNCECSCPGFQALSKKEAWKNDAIQFPRLIAELEMAGAFTRKNLMADLRDSMDLTDAEILELVERASNFWEGAKFAICPPAKR